MTSTLFGKAWGILILLLTVSWAIFLGMDLQSNDWRGAIVDTILLAFWLFTAVFLHYMALRELRSDLKFEQTKKELDTQLQDLLNTITDHSKHNHGHLQADHFDDPSHQALSDQFDAIMEEVTGDEGINPKHITEIKARFEAKTGHQVKIEQHPLGLKVSIAKDPMTKPTTKKAPVKKSAPVTKKPVTKKGK